MSRVVCKGSICMSEYTDQPLAHQPNAECRQKVLLVDDQPLNLAVASAVLEDICLPLQACNGETALQLALSEQPALILLDVCMPSMDGFEVCRRLKQNPATAGIAVVFLTALDEESDEEYGLNHGAIDYISKPFSSAVLRARVRNHLLTQRQRQQLERLAHSDGLTGIANRRHFDAKFRQEWQRFYELQLPLGLLLIDVDHFKPYNDLCGHLAGDYALQQIAQTLEAQMRREGDMASRYGGEEFACILPQTDNFAVVKIAERIRNAVLNLRIAHPASTAHAWLSVSIGARSMIPGAHNTLRDFIDKTDQCLYMAKHRGRDQVVNR